VKLPRDLSGAELIKLVCKHHDYYRVNQEGSHEILETQTPIITSWRFPTIIRCALAPSMPSCAVADIKALAKDDILHPT